jgi:prevent-host-death family protein
MRTTSLAEAKAHLSELVDQAEHHGRRILILRHGKPAAAIVPTDVVAARRPRSMPLGRAARSVRAFVAEFSAADPGTSAVEDLMRSRR